jgi:hypothetical protein
VSGKGPVLHHSQADVRLRSSFSKDGICIEQKYCKVGAVCIHQQGLKINMGHAKDIITKLLINVTDPVIVIDILNNI